LQLYAHAVAFRGEKFHYRAQNLIAERIYFPFMELSSATRILIEKYKLWQKSQQPKQGVSTIHVDEVALRVAAFYEHLRTIVDWKEEHLMRRSAIIRKLKRRFLDLELNNFSQSENLAEALLFELIRGGHFANDKIEESKIISVQKVINKYIFILKNSPENKTGRAGLQFYNWILEVSACEIEETLEPSIKEMALIDYMFSLMQDKIKVNEKIYESGDLKKEDKNIQIYVAVQQALFKLDKPIISYNLIKYKYSQWDKATEDLLLRISQNIYKIWRDIENDLANPIAKKFYTICEKYDTPYLLLGDILSENDVENTAKEISEPPLLESLIKKTYLKRLSTLKGRIRRAAIYSTVSIFITKILTLIILEILLSKLLMGRLDSIILIADVLIPTFLMFILVSTIKKPSAKNLNIVIMEAMKIVYRKEGEDVYEIKARRQKGVMTRIIISIVYVLSTFLSFGAIYLTLKYFGFPVTSIIINIIFIALILFTGTAVGKRAEELTIEDEKEGFMSFLSDVFFLPVQGLGKWISAKWKKYNAVTAFFNALIDMPFSAFVEFIEKWRYFIKERKEDMR
jgi:hypothetical protein